MDVYCLPSYRERFGVTLLEAVAMRLPIVATRTPGCIDAIAEGINGLLVEPRSSCALAIALLRYLRDLELRGAGGEAGRQRALRDFARRPIWRAFADEYERFVQRSPARPT